MKKFPEFMKKDCYHIASSQQNTKGIDGYYFEGKEHILHPGDEVLVPKGTRHCGRVKAGTRTIHCFGGQRIKQ